MTKGILAAAGVALLLIAGCGGGAGDAANENGALAGAVQIDGSSTVYPITEAIAEQFRAEAGRDVRVTVGVSGTGGGFKRFCGGETDINDASRPITEDEAAQCRQNNVEVLELPVAYDGMAILVNNANNWVQCLTVAELKRIWEPESRINNWSQVRTGFPNEKLDLFGPGTSSGTFDYFTEAVVGKARASRADYTASEDDNIIVKGVEGTRGGLGYVGYAYFKENETRLKGVAIDGGSGCVTPSPETIAGGTYAPLSRPLYIYVRKSALGRPEVAAFVRFYLEQAPRLVPQVGYIPLEAAKYQTGLQQIGAPAAG